MVVEEAHPDRAEDPASVGRVAAEEEPGREEDPASVGRAAEVVLVAIQYKTIGHKKVRHLNLNVKSPAAAALLEAAAGQLFLPF